MAGVGGSKREQRLMLALIFFLHYMRSEQKPFGRKLVNFTIEHTESSRDHTGSF